MYSETAFRVNACQANALKRETMLQELRLLQLLYSTPKQGRHSMINVDKSIDSDDSVYSDSTLSAISLASSNYYMSGVVDDDITM